MKVFISSSGLRSRDLALTLRTWLRDVIHLVEPWASDRDIPAGLLWSSEVMGTLAAAAAGVICVTPENQSEPWILFEAGALANRLGTSSKVCVFLLGMQQADVRDGPLRLYQLTTADKRGTLKLVQSLNESLQDRRLSEDMLSRSFERCWPELEAVIHKLSGTALVSANLLRSTEQLLSEVLGEVQRLARQNEDLLNAIYVRPQDSSREEEASRHQIRAQRVQEDLAASATQKLRSAAERNAPELVPVIDKAVLQYDPDGMYQMIIEGFSPDLNTRNRLLETLNELARQAGLGWGMHVHHLD